MVWKSMNPFSSPVFLAKILKSYFFDINRLNKISNETLRRYQDKQLRKMVAFAYTVPVYHDLYKQAGVHPHDITGIQDITKLPFISKEEITKYYPDGIISLKTQRSSLIEVSTSGTSGKSLSLFVDPFDIVMGLFGYVRALSEYGISWRKNKITIIGDFATHTAETGYIKRGILPHLKFGSFFDNIQWLNTNDDPEKIMDDLAFFKPDFIGGYAGMLGHLALLKEKGLGTDVSPKCIASTGSVLDPALKSFIEESFHTHLFEAYGATESGPIAFQCIQGTYHVLSDLVYLEFVKDDKPVVSGQPGKLVVTKLYGRGTPFLRYTSVNDIVAPRDTKCSCGLAGDRIEKIYGRDDLALFLPGGRVILASSISNIFSKLLYELKTNKVKGTKIIQPNEQKIEISLVIDDRLRNEGPSVEEICEFLLQRFQEKTGLGVESTVKEVKNIDGGGPRIVSYVDRQGFKIREYV